MVEKSEILRTWINKKLDESFDYSQTANRSSDFKDFLQSEDAKKNGFNYKQHNPLYYSLLRKCCIDRGLDPATYGLKRSQSTRVQRDMASTITPKPKATSSKPQEKEPEKETSGETAEEESQEPYQEPLVDLETSKLTCNFAYEMIRLKYKEWSPLSEEEQTGLGKAWLRLMQKYMTSKYFEFVIPVIATIGVLSKKAKEAKERGPQKEKTVDEKDPARQQQERQEGQKENGKIHRAGWLDKIGVDEKNLQEDKSGALK